MQSDDDAIVAAQIGRPSRANTEVMRRCDWNLPLVVRMPPTLNTGEPFPTRYWLSCPLLHKRVARIEAEGGVQHADERLRTDDDFAATMAAANERYREDRESADANSGSERLARGGVGGATGGIKCLHAHLAHALATDENPLGAEIVQHVFPVDCDQPCVIRADSGYKRNDLWREPK
ncbi:MAG: DUF501 domain-containing protein [Polyangiales bacterium]